MASTYSTNLAIELIGTGDQAGSWGNTTNTNLGTLIEQAISGYVTQAVATGTDTTITIPNGATGVARNMYIELTGTGGTNTNLIVPANKKLYFIFNNSTGAVTVKVSGQTGVSVPQGKKVVLTSNGTDVVNGLNYIADFGSNSATITQLTATSATITNLTLTSLVISNLSIASANITTLTSTNATAASLTVSTGNLTFSGTAQRITGDMSNATQSSRLLFQTSTTNGTTNIGAIPNGTGTTAQLLLANSSDPTNASRARFNVGPSEAQINIDLVGTGTNLPLTFHTGGSERMRLDTSGNLGIGLTPTYKFEVSSTSSDVARFTVSNKSIDGTGNIQVFTSNNQAADLGGSIALGGKNGSGGVFDPWAFGVIKGAKENSTSSNLAGYLAFATANSGGTVSERMRIDSSGNLGLGTTTPANYANYRNLAISGTTGANIDMLSGSTKVGNLFNDATNFYAYNVIAGSLVFGTNNAERARFDSSGNLGIGTTSPATNLSVVGTGITDAGGGGAYQVTVDNNAAYNLTPQGGIIHRFKWSSAGTLTTGAGIRFYKPNTNDSDASSQIGFLVRSGIAAQSQAMTLDSSGNVGIGTASPSGRLDAEGSSGATYFNFSATAGGAASVFSLLGGTASEQAICFNSGALRFGTVTGKNAAGFTERMRIDSSGNVGIGGTAAAYEKISVSGTYPTSSNVSQGFVSKATIPSGATSSFVGYYSVPSTQAAAFTCTSLYHFLAGFGTKGASSAITSQYGFLAGSDLTGATNNYGFYSDIASGSNRWNFYAAGTARNYFAGNIGVGADSAVVRIFARGANAASTDYVFYGENSDPTLLFYVRNDGIVNTGVAANSPYNYTTGSAANLYVDNSGVLYRSTSSLRYKTNVVDAVHGLADVLKLRSVTYKGKNDGDTVFGGLIAEEVHDAGLTEFVAYDKEGRPDALHYGNMVALLVKAVQELSAKVVALEAR